MKAFFYSSHTLYLKSLIPLIIEFQRRGHEVVVSKNAPNFMGYSPEKFAKHPTRNVRVNSEAYSRVARMIGYEEEWAEVLDKIKFSFWVPRKADCVIGTFKDLHYLRTCGVQKAIVVGYYHSPIVGSLRGRLEVSPSAECREIFLSDNAFSLQHQFTDFLGRIPELGFVNFPYLDRVFKHQKEQTLDHVLIFHPGGYRDVLTAPGADRETSYKRQTEFMKRMCGPAFDAGLKPVIKTHPLFAQFHSKRDLETIRAKIAREDPRFQNVIITDESFWPYASRARWALSFGTSSMYELFLARMSRVLICDFFGNDRSSKFSMFEGASVRDDGHLKEILSDENFKPQWTSLEERVIRAYGSLFTGNATQTIVDQASL